MIVIFFAFLLRGDKVIFLVMLSFQLKFINSFVEIEGSDFPKMKYLLEPLEQKKILKKKN